MKPWEYEFVTDPTTNLTTLTFGEQLVAKAGVTVPQKWKVELFNHPAKASAVVTGAGLMALRQRDEHPGRIGAFDITSALKEVADIDTAAEAAVIGASLELAWQRLVMQLARAKYRP
jgi:hypothetical protein